LTGVAITIPSPGSGTGSTYLARCSATLYRIKGAAAAVRGRRDQGRESAAPVPNPYCRKRRLVIVDIASTSLMRGYVNCKILNSKLAAHMWSQRREFVI